LIEEAIVYSDLDGRHKWTVRRYQLVTTILAMLAEMFLAADWYGFAAVLSFASKTLHLNPQQAGMAQGVFAVVYAASLFLWGPLADKLKARRMIGFGLITTGIVMFGQGLAHNYAQLLIARMVIGFFDAAVFVGVIKLIAEWYPPARRGLQMALILGAYSFSITLDFAVGVPMAQSLGWRDFLYLLALCTVLMGIVSAFTVRNRPLDLQVPEFIWDGTTQTIENTAGLLRTIFSQKWIYIGGIAIFGDTFAISAGSTWVVPAFLQTQHISTGTATAIGTIMGLSQVLFLIIGGMLSDRLRRRILPIRLGAAFAGGSAVLFALATIIRLPTIVLLLVTAVSGVAVFSGGAIFSMLAEKYGQELVGSAAGYAEIMGIIATFVAPSAMGALINATTFSAGFWLFAVVEGIIFIILMFSVTEYRL
jgi:MFS family permease